LLPEFERIQPIRLEAEPDVELADVTTPPVPTSINVPDEDATLPELVAVLSVKDKALRFCPMLPTWAAVSRFERLIVTVPAPVVIMAEASTC
jgi:hypothetical protein